MSIKHIMGDLRHHFNKKQIKVAELGILHGEGIPLFLNNLNIEEYHGIDLFSNYEENKDGSYDLMKNQGDSIYNGLKNKYKSDKRVNIHKGWTHEIVKNFENDYFDLVFIDAGHEYPQVSKDIELWYPKVKKGGIFSGDDYFYPPVSKSVHEFVDKHGYTLFNSKSRNPDPNFNNFWSWYIKI